ncbi:MAG: YHS domain-containing protein [Dehalococcoidia bacterium]|nr:YHS domain-containing protein [Dehalococcoidia bacterium]
METLVAVLPIALIALACPLLMLFLMRGAHGGSGGGPHHASGDPAERLTQIEGELEHLRRELAQDRRTAPVAEEWLAPTVPVSDHETSPRGPSTEGGNVGIIGRLFSKEGKATDPVCAMSFRAQRAAATTTYGGTVYQFCSGSCQSLFERDPEVFALKAARRGLEG